MSSQQKSEELSVCLKTPKFGTLAFFLVMLILIPVTLVISDNTDILKYYLPFTVLLASTLTSAGSPNNFNDLYPLFPNTVMGFLSANLINFLALIGILWITVNMAFDYNSINLGVIVGLIMITITFPVATQAIPFFIRQGDKTLKRLAPRAKFPGEWHKYFLGLLMTMVVIMVEVLLISLLTNSIEQTM
jgi:hypothetical protein